MKTAIEYTKQLSNSVSQLPTGQSGFRAIITVTSATNITAKIFAYQREVLTAAGEDFLDTYYSVCSVADLEEYPETPSASAGFYRDNTVDVVYRTIEDLNKYTAQIEVMIKKLIAANDLAINLQPATTVTL